VRGRPSDAAPAQISSTRTEADEPARIGRNAPALSSSEGARGPRCGQPGADRRRPRERHRRQGSDGRERDDVPLPQVGHRRHGEDTQKERRINDRPSSVRQGHDPARWRGASGRRGYCGSPRRCFVTCPSRLGDATERAMAGSSPRGVRRRDPGADAAHGARLLELILGPLVENPRRVGWLLSAEPGTGLRMARVGSYRVTCELHDDDRVIEVMAVNHSGDTGRRAPSRATCAPSSRPGARFRNRIPRRGRGKPSGSASCSVPELPP
jgi:mRNA-degrading endonuclease RelE of RelBE toxin-antitoxin system